MKEFRRCRGDFIHMTAVHAYIYVSLYNESYANPWMTTWNDKSYGKEREANGGTLRVRVRTLLVAATTRLVHGSCDVQPPTLLANTPMLRSVRAQWFFGRTEMAISHCLTEKHAMVSKIDTVTCCLTVIGAPPRYIRLFVPVPKTWCICLA